MSVVFFLVSSIFFQVFISSCLSRAIRLARSWASRSSLATSVTDFDLLFAAFFGVGECRLLLLEKFRFVLELRVDSILITQIFLLGGNPDDVLAFGAAQIETFTLHSLTAIL